MTLNLFVCLSIQNFLQFGTNLAWVATAGGLVWRARLQHRVTFGPRISRFLPLLSQLQNSLFLIKIVFTSPEGPVYTLHSHPIKVVSKPEQVRKKLRAANQGMHNSSLPHHDTFILTPIAPFQERFLRRFCLFRFFSCRCEEHANHQETSSRRGIGWEPLGNSTKTTQSSAPASATHRTRGLLPCHECHLEWALFDLDRHGLWRTRQFQQQRRGECPWRHTTEWIWALGPFIFVFRETCTNPNFSAASSPLSSSG